MHIKGLSDDIAVLEHAVSHLFRSFCIRLCNDLLLLLRHDAPLTLLQFKIRRLRWRPQWWLHRRHVGHDKRRDWVWKACLLPFLANWVQLCELLLELKQALWSASLLGYVKPLNGLGRAALPRLADAVTTLCIDLIEIANRVLSLRNRISGRLPIIHTAINILHIVRYFIELVIEFMLLNL